MFIAAPLVQLAPPADKTRDGRGVRRTGRGIDMRNAPPGSLINVRFFDKIIYFRSACSLQHRGCKAMRPDVAAPALLIMFSLLAHINEIKANDRDAFDDTCCRHALQHQPRHHRAPHAQAAMPAHPTRMHPHAHGWMCAGMDARTFKETLQAHNLEVKAERTAMWVLACSARRLWAGSSNTTTSAGVICCTCLLSHARMERWRQDTSTALSCSETCSQATCCVAVSSHPASRRGPTSGVPRFSPDCFANMKWASWARVVFDRQIV